MRMRMRRFGFGFGYSLPMAKRRARLVPKVVFRVALTATAVPLLAGCPQQHLTVANLGYGVAAVGYGPPDQDASRGTPPELTVAAPAFVNPPPEDASLGAAAFDASPTDASKLDASKLDASKLDASKLDAGRRDAAALEPKLTDQPPLPGVAARGYTNPTGAGPVVPTKPPSKP